VRTNFWRENLEAMGRLEQENQVPADSWNLLNWFGVV
jgi:hypothetical protein